MTNLDRASDKQLDLIRRLVAEKLDDEMTEVANERLAQGLDWRLASAWIQKLLALPSQPPRPTGWAGSLKERRGETKRVG